MIDNINHPAHYNLSDTICSCGRTIECIDITRHLNFNIGNAIKYLWRFEYKNGVEDLEKAIWYIKDEIDTRKKILDESEKISPKVNFQMPPKYSCI